MSTAETRNVSIDASGKLDTGELLTGTPTIQGSANLTFSNQQVNSSELTINGATVAIGNAVQFTVQCNIPGRYKIEMECNTDANQVIEGEITLIVSKSKY